jgi:hypothetical protein
MNRHFPSLLCRRQRIFPDDDTMPPFCDNLDCLKSFSALREEIRRAGNRLSRFGKKSDASETVFRVSGRNSTRRKSSFVFREEIRCIGNHLKAIQTVAHVIANPQGEAIHAGTLDCFTAFAMTEGVTAIVIIRYKAIRQTNR